jgi:hypothetical protein
LVHFETRRIIALPWRPTKNGAFYYCRYLSINNKLHYQHCGYGDEAQKSALEDESIKKQKQELSEFIDKFEVLDSECAAIDRDLDHTVRALLSSTYGRVV